MSRHKYLLPIAAALAFATVAVPAARAEDPSFGLTIKNHKFEPVTVEVPAGKRFKLVVHNADSTPEEFESHQLKREKVIPGGGKATILIGPLKPGTYKFVGEFHEDTAKGNIVAK